MLFNFLISQVPNIPDAPDVKSPVMWLLIVVVVFGMILFTWLAKNMLKMAFERVDSTIKTVKELEISFKNLSQGIVNMNKNQNEMMRYYVAILREEKRQTVFLEGMNDMSKGKLNSFTTTGTNRGGVLVCEAAMIYLDKKYSGEDWYVECRDKLADAIREFEKNLD